MCAISIAGQNNDLSARREPGHGMPLNAYTEALMPVWGDTVLDPEGKPGWPRHDRATRIPVAVGLSSDGSGQEQKSSLLLLLRLPCATLVATMEASVQRARQPATAQHF